MRRRHHDAPAFSAVRTTHARGAGWRRTFRHDNHALANASATWSSASCTLPVLAATALRHGSQMAWKNSANSVFS
jgi:hypothetical protein